MIDRHEDYGGFRWHVAKYVDVPVGRWVDGNLLPMEPVRYRHDGAGGVIMTGGVIKRSRVLSEAFMQNRLVGLEGQRAAAAAREHACPQPEWYEDILWSLTEARDQAAKWRAAQ